MSSNTLNIVPFFSPTSITGCQLWLDAADPTTVSLTGSTVTQWRDKSRNNYLGAFSAGRNFTYATNIRNSLNAIQTATGQSMTISNFAMPATMSLFHVYMPINQSSGSAFIEQGLNVSDFDGFFFFSQDNVNFAIRNSGIVSVTNFGTTAVSNTWEMIESINKDPNASNTMSYYTNGTLRASGGNTTTNITVTDTLYLNGRNNTNTLSYPTYIAEIIIYNVALSNSQRQQVEGYLAWKWGLQGSLPSNHPFRNAGPTTIATIPPPLRGSVTNSLAPSSTPFSFFNPTSVTGCSLWLDAADPSTVALSGSSVTQWNDKSGSGNNATQGTSGNRPTYASSTVSFNGSQWFQTPISSAPTTESFFIVINTTTNSSVDVFSGTALGYRELIIYNSNLFVGAFGSTPSGTNGGAITTNTRLQFNYQYTTTLVNFRVNGSATGSGTPTATYSGTNTSYIGSSSYAPNNLVGSINEIIYYNTSLTSSQAQTIEGYLAWKWGLTANLPSNHPFKNSPPGLTIPVVPPTRQLANRFWSPLNVSGSALWLDAADPVAVLTSGSTVSQWTDKSGNGRHATQSTQANRPFYVTNALNRLPVISFTGSPYSLSGASGGFVVNGLSTMTSFFVANNTTGQSNMFPPYGDQNCLISWNGTGSWGVVAVDIWQMKIQWRFGTGQANNDPTYTFPVNQGTAYNLVTVSKTNLNEFLNVNGSTALAYTAANTTIANTDSTYNLSLGPAGYGTNNVGEIIIYTASLTTAQIQQVEGYLAWKWGLQGSLPANHPWKRWPPPP